MVEGQPNPARVLTLPGIPPYLDEQDYNGIKVKLRRYGVERAGVDQCKVTCFYDNDNSSTGPQLPDTTDPNYIDYAVSVTRVGIKVPTYTLYKERREEESSPGGPTLSVIYERWEPSEVEIDLYQTTAEVQVTLNYMNNGVRTFIASQGGRLHKFPDGTFWKFQGASINRQTDEAWSIVYRWVHDPGSLVSDRPGAPGSNDKSIMVPFGNSFEFVDSNSDTNVLTTGSLIVPSIERRSFDEYMRKPQEEPFTLNSPSSFREMRPSIAVVPREALWTIDEDGYRLLPGNPIP